MELRPGHQEERAWLERVRAANANAANNADETSQNNPDENTDMAVEEENSSSEMLDTKTNSSAKKRQ